MAAKKGPRKVRAYGDEFKAKAVLLCLEPGVLTKDVAESLDIHPFMLSRWKKEFREGMYVADAKQLLDQGTVAELKRLQEVERAYQRLQLEHDLLKKAIRFSSEQRERSSASSTRRKKAPGT